MGLVGRAKAAGILPGCLHSPFGTIRPAAGGRLTHTRSTSHPNHLPFPPRRCFCSWRNSCSPIWEEFFCNALRANVAHLSHPPLQWLLCRCQPQAPRLALPWHSLAGGHPGLEAIFYNSFPWRDHGAKQRRSCVPRDKSRPPGQEQAGWPLGSGAMALPGRVPGKINPSTI